MAKYYANPSFLFERQKKDKAIPVNGSSIVLLVLGCFSRPVDGLAAVIFFESLLFVFIFALYLQYK